MLPHMPQGLEADELEQAIEDATDGICVAFHEDSLEQVSHSRQPATQHGPLTV